MDLIVENKLTSLKKNTVFKEKTYFCDQCQYETTQKNNLNRHKDSVHNGRIYLWLIPAVFVIMRQQ